ncbi:MAG: MotA/TolQ/ExbB proton channel family protein [Chloroherpetonaceae bacterium]|nr:MotA/TolQ/ExbB proton channel family protein [Chloroherpetonaceae bacterium]MDW8437094.1 MotA/TolQ/ExbB proton channel family protein [Chloroherpetonaceae bacterium]
MKNNNKLFLWAVIITSFILSYVIYFFVFGTAPKGSLLHYFYEGGPIIGTLMTAIMVLIVVVSERVWSYQKARGKGDFQGLMARVKKALENGQINEALQECEKHGSAIASSIASGLERYRSLDEVEPRFNAKIQEVQKAIDEAANFESAQFETNLTPIKTIATIATLIGLLGTTIGMIRAFAAISQAGGTPDPTSLSGAISEALYNTAGGLFAAIVGTTMYNYFKAEIDNFTYFIDEAAFEVIQTLTISRRNLISERERAQ